MPTLIIDCKGLHLNGINIPNFQVYTGDYVTLLIPQNYSEHLWQSLTALFSGTSPHKQVTIMQPVSVIKEPQPQHSIMRLIKPTRIKNYLRQFKSVTDTSSIEITTTLNLHLTDNMWTLGATTKKMLALETAYRHSPNVVLNTAGMDYSGLLMVYSRVKKTLQNGAAVELRFPTISLEDVYFEDSVIIEAYGS